MFREQIYGNSSSPGRQETLRRVKALSSELHLSMGNHWFNRLLLTLIILIIYWPVTRSEFLTWDDPFFITQNPNVMHGITFRGLHYALTSLDGLYQPVTYLSFILESQLFGLKSAAFHTTNLWLHIGNTLCLYLLAYVILRSRRLSTVLAAVFALHPLNVETVAWASERKGLLAAFFALISVLLYIKHQTSTSKRYFMLSVGAFTLAALSKGNIIGLPFLMWLWPPKRAIRTFPRSSYPSVATAAQMLLPFIIAFLIFLLNVLAEHNVGALKALTEYPLAVRLANTVVIPALQLLRFVIPRDLRYFYPATEPGPLTVIGSLLMFGCLILCFLQLRRNRAVLFGVTWFVLFLLPHSGLAQIDHHFTADRYMYMPMIGLLLLIGGGFQQLRYGFKPKIVTLCALCVLILVLLTSVTRQQLRFWRTSQDLYRRALTLNTEDWKSHNNIGALQLNEGDLRSAKQEFRKALLIKPNHFAASYNLGIALLREKSFSKARIWLMNAREIEPEYLGIEALIGHCLQAIGETKKALAYYKRSLALDADERIALFGLATVYAGSPDMALRDGYSALSVAIRLNAASSVPDIKSKFALSMAYAELGDFDKALGAAESAANLARASGNTNALQFIKNAAMRYHAHEPLKTLFVDYD